MIKEKIKRTRKRRIHVEMKLRNMKQKGECEEFNKSRVETDFLRKSSSVNEKESRKQTKTIK